MGQEDRDDMRGDILKVFEEQESDERPEGEEEEGGSKEDSEEPIRASEAEEEVEKEEKPEEEEKPEKKIDASAKAPQSWRPEVRQHWSKIPAEAQAEISRRELEISRTLNYTAEARKLAQQFVQVIQPYEGLIRAQNSTPMQAVASMMQTSARLTLGSPLQKAQAVADVIRQFGIDIETLDAVLANDPKVSKGTDVSDTVRRVVSEQLNPLVSRLTADEKARRDAELAEAQREMEEFASKNEFFEDFREEMGDLIESAHRRGKKMSLQAAYDAVLATRPELKKIVDASKKPALPANQKKVIKAKKLASSLSSSGTPSGKKVAEGDDRRSDIEEAWGAAS